MSRRLLMAARTAAFPMMLLAACSDRAAVQSRTHSRSGSPDDGAFAQVQSRGHVAMGVDQYTSTDRFESLPDGGRITLVRDRDDPAGVTQIRAHMVAIGAAFRRGDFTVPGFVHDRAVPGTATMAARQSRISYIADTVPHGGSLRILSTDSVAISAIHQFLAFQRQDHRSPHADASH
jgi:hypothetical protein